MCTYICVHACMYMGRNLWKIYNKHKTFYDHLSTIPCSLQLCSLSLNLNYQNILFKAHLKSCQFTDFHNSPYEISGIMWKGLGNLCMFCFEFHVSSYLHNSYLALAAIFTFAIFFPKPILYCWYQSESMPMSNLILHCYMKFPTSKHLSLLTFSFTFCSFSLLCMQVIYSSGVYHVLDFVGSIVTSNSYNTLKARLLIVWQLFLHSWLVLCSDQTSS